MFVIGAQFAFTQDFAFPLFDLRNDPGQQAQSVVRGQDRHSDHVAEHAGQKQPMHLSTQFARLLNELIGGHAVEDLTEDPTPLSGERYAIVGPTMTEIIAIAAIVIVAWFAAGTTWNIRRGRLLMHWMQDGLPVLGQRTTVRWLGSTAVELALRAGNAPFDAVTLIIFLEPRDMPWMWAIGRVGGRRDILIIRGVLRGLPELEFEALDPISWSGREARRRLPLGWAAHPIENAGDICVYSAKAAAAARAGALLAEAHRAGIDVKRLAVRRAEPHFQIHIALPEQAQPARAFFEAVQTIAGRALE